MFAERQGFEPWRQLPAYRLAICSITTLAPLQSHGLASFNADANVPYRINSSNFFLAFLSNSFLILESESLFK